MTRYFDLSNPEAPKQTYAKQTGRQVNMISQSWTEARLHHLESAGALGQSRCDNEQFLRGSNWDGKELKPAFEVDFAKENSDGLTI